MKTLSAIAVLGLVACGQSNENVVKLTKAPQQAATEPVIGEGEEQLGLSAKDASMVGDYAALINTITKLVPSGATQAFGSVAKFTDTVTQNRCSGAFAYEPDPVSPATHANLYYYTATHCFEKVNSVGKTLIPVRTSVLSQKTLGAAETFNAPFKALNILKKSIPTTTAEIQYEGPVRTDVIRFFQGRVALGTLKTRHLPTCRTATNIVPGAKLISGVHAVDASGIIQAHSYDRTSLRAGNIADGESLKIPNSGIGTLLLLDRLGTIPGESGSPVWLIDGDRQISTTKSYLCLQGVISREVIKPELQPDGSAEFKVSSYYSPILPTSAGVRWEKVQ